MRSQEEPRRIQEDPGGAWRNQEEPGGAMRLSCLLLGSFWLLLTPPGPLRPRQARRGPGLRSPKGEPVAGDLGANRKILIEESILG